jgi:hypothetical protein
MSAVDTAITEIQAAVADLAPRHEGLRDFARLNLQPQTIADVQAAVAVYDRRVGLMNEALAVLQRLVADGYPRLDSREVDAAVLKELQDNAATIEAALSQFAPTIPKTLGLTAGPPVPK